MKAQDTKIKATPSVTTPASASPTPTTPSSSIMPGCEFVGNADKEWAIGDIAWGGMGKFPYWPCIIMNDPLSKTHVCEKSWYLAKFCTVVQEMLKRKSSGSYKVQGNLPGQKIELKPPF